MASSPVVCIMGPTASGKTALAAHLRAHHPVELVSVDSAQVYRGMDIGTAKPDASLPHRLIDILDPAESYSAARFRTDALREIEDIVSLGRIPVLVGGTMLYFRALIHGLSDMPAADLEIRARIEQRASELGWEAMHAELAEVDAEAAARIHPNDPQRIQRALEVHELTGRPISELQRAPGPEGGYRFCRIAVTPGERATLHERIETRFEAMLAAGFLDEVRALRARPDLHPDLPSMRAVGYRQLWAHLAGEVDLSTAANRGVHATRQLAKRQLTWLRKERDLPWVDSALSGWLEVAAAEVRRMAAL